MIWYFIAWCVFGFAVTLFSLWIQQGIDVTLEDLGPAFIVGVAWPIILPAAWLIGKGKTVVIRGRKK